MENSGTEKAVSQMNIVKFGLEDTRTGDHSYSGYYTTYKLCNGVSHYEVGEPEGVFTQWRCREVGPCDDSCKNGKEVNPMDLPYVAQREMGIKIPVPVGQVLVTTWSGEKSWEGWGFHAYSQGEMVTPAELRRGTIILEGKSAPFSSCRYGQHGCSEIPERVFNRGGVAVTEHDREPGKKFAQQQAKWLVEQGFTDEEAREIMRQARPGQVRKAVEWAAAVKKQWQQETPDLTERTIEVTLEKAIKASRGHYGWARTAKAVEELTGFEAPRASNARMFFGIIEGAVKVLQIGFPVKADA